MKRTVFFNLLLVLVLGITAACTRQRPDRGEQGAFDLKTNIRDLLGDTDLRKLDGDTVQAQDLANGGRYIPETNSILSPLVFELRTGKKVAIPGNTSSESLQIEEGHPFFNDFVYVDYTTNDQFLPLGLHILARENRTYELRYELTESYLKIYKVGNREDIPYVETTYARGDLVPGKLAVPIWGYPISYFRTEKVLNSNDRETNILRPFPVRIVSAEDYKTVRYYELDMKGGTEFKAVDKSELFPKDFFTSDEWFSTIVIAHSRPVNASSVGAVINPGETSFMSALKTRFHITETELLAYDLNIDPDIDIDDRKNLISRIRLPIVNVDTRIAPTGRNDTAMEEQEYNKRNWQEREYVKIQWKNIGTDIAQSYLGANLEDATALGTPSITELRIANNFWSFTLRYELIGIEIRFGFRKVSDANRIAYEPKRFYTDDLQFFAYFWGQRQDILNYQNPRYDDLSRLSYVARFNPKRDVEFHLSTKSPQTPWMEEAVKKALAIWDRAFELAGTNVNIKYNPRRVELGDSRFNIVNIVDSEYETGGLLGYGPSFNDPYTGEIISATSNVYISHMRASAASSIRNYIRWKGGDLDLDRFEMTGLRETLDVGAPGSPLGSSYSGVFGGYIPNLLFVKIGDEENKTDSNRERPQLRFEVPQIPVAPNGGVAFINHGYKDMYEVDERTAEFMENPLGVLNKTKAMLADPGLKEKDPEFYERWVEPMDLRKTNATCSQNQAFRTSRGMVRAIETKCPEIVSFAEQKVGQPVTTDEDLFLVEQCAEKIMYVQFMQTLIHELGHNFGLIHNFQGSTETDPTKYWNAETAREAFGSVLDPNDIEDHEVAVSNSVMDYYSEDAGGGLVQALPGPYDIAAIRFGYTGLIEGKDEDGKKGFIQVGNRSIREAVNENIDRIEPYQQCTDLELDVDVLCTQHDLGRTPTQIVQNARNQYFDSLVLSNRRFDRRSVGIDGVLRALTYLYPVRKIYDHWRLELARILFEGDSNLANFGSDQASINSYYQTIQQTAATNPEFQKLVDDFLPARNEAFNLFLELAFLPNAYCVVNTPGFQPGVEARTSMGLLPGQTLVDLNFIRQKVRDDKPRDAFYMVRSCMDQPVREYLGQLGLEVVDEIGFSVDQVKYDPSDNAILRPFDDNGTFYDRIVTTALFTQRSPWLIESIEKGVYPSILDEPDFRQTTEVLLEDRLVNGVRPATSLITENPAEYMQQVPVRKYYGEANLLLNQFLLMKDGLTSGGPQTWSRGDRYSAVVYLETQQGIFGQNTDGILMGGYIIRPGSPRATFVRSLISELQQTVSLRSAGNQFLPEEVSNVFRDLIVEGLPSGPSEAFTGQDLMDLFDRATAAKYVGSQLAAAMKNPGLTALIQNYIDNILSADLYVGSALYGNMVSDKLSLENQIAFWRAQKENYIQQQTGDSELAPRLSPGDIIGTLPVPNTDPNSPDAGEDSKDAYYEQLSELGKAVHDAMKSVLNQIPKLEYEVVVADYDKEIAELEAELRRVNLYLRTNGETDLRRIYQQLQIPLPTKKAVVERFEASFRQWDDKAQWASQSYNSHEVDAYEELVYNLLLTLGR